MTTSVLVASGAVTQQVAAVQDAISIATGSTGTQYCGNRLYSITSVISTATTGLDSSSLSIGSNDGLISVQSTNNAQIGTHTATVTVSLADFSAVSSVSATFTITILACAVTSVKVVQQLDQGNLQPQTYTLSSADSLTYQLEVKLTPNCGYASSDWVVTATGGPAPANFQNIGSSTGLYTVGPTIQTTQAGTYAISITSVTVESIVYGASPMLLLTPSSFTLTVIDPCQTTTVTSSTVSSVTLVVWDLESFYPSSGAAFTDFTDSISSLNADPTMCAKSYSATVTTNSGG